MIYAAAFTFVFLLCTIASLCKKRRWDANRIEGLKNRLAKHEAVNLSNTESFLAKRDLDAGEAVTTADVGPCNPITILKDVMTTTPAWQGDVAAYRRKHPELKEAWDRAEGPDESAGCIIIDDCYVNTDNTMVEAHRIIDTQAMFDKVFKKHVDNDGPIVYMHSRIHEDDFPGFVEATKQRIEQAFAVPQHMLGDPDYLDSTLDYSWLSLTRIRCTHPHHFRPREWADIKGVRMALLKRRESVPCFWCSYPDGGIDQVPFSALDDYELDGEQR